MRELDALQSLRVASAEGISDVPAVRMRVRVRTSAGGSPSDHVARGTCRLLFDDTNPTRTAWKAPSTTATTISAEAMSVLPLIKHMNAAAKTNPSPKARLFQVKTRFIWRSFDKQRTSVVDAKIVPASNGTCYRRRVPSLPATNGALTGDGRRESTGLDRASRD